MIRTTGQFRDTDVQSRAKQCSRFFLLFLTAGPQEQEAKPQHLLLLRLSWGGDYEMCKHRACSGAIDTDGWLSLCWESHRDAPRQAGLFPSLLTGHGRRGQRSKQSADKVNVGTPRFRSDRIPEKHVVHNVQIVTLAWNSHREVRNRKVMLLVAAREQLSTADLHSHADLAWILTAPSAWVPEGRGHSAVPPPTHNAYNSSERSTFGIGHCDEQKSS